MLPLLRTTGGHRLQREEGMQRGVHQVLMSKQLTVLEEDPLWIARQRQARNCGIAQRRHFYALHAVVHELLTPPTAAVATAAILSQKASASTHGSVQVRFKPYCRVTHSPTSGTCFVFHVRAHPAWNQEDLHRTCYSASASYFKLPRETRQVRVWYICNHM